MELSSDPASSRKLVRAWRHLVEITWCDCESDPQGLQGGGSWRCEPWGRSVRDKVKSISSEFYLFVGYLVFSWFYVKLITLFIDNSISKINTMKNAKEVPSVIFECWKPCPRTFRQMTSDKLIRCRWASYCNLKPSLSASFLKYLQHLLNNKG